MSKRASEEAFEELHALLTNEIIARIKSGKPLLQTFVLLLTG